MWGRWLMGEHVMWVKDTTHRQAAHIEYAKVSYTIFTDNIICNEIL